VPDVVGLWEAVEEEERWAGPGFDAVDCDIWGDGDVEFFEAFEHFANSIKSVNSFDGWGLWVLIYSIYCVITPCY